MFSSLLQVEATGLYSPLDVKLKSAVLRKDIPKLRSVTRASRLGIRPAPETASCGIPQLDALTGGLPRGCLTEVCGPESSGRTSLLLAALAAATRREEICTLIDASDAFDPQSAAAAGVNLERLLWVRCRTNSPSSSLSHWRRNTASREEQARRRMEDPVEQALRATDLLLESSGFGMVVMDLAGIPFKMARRIPLTTWFRFRRAVENMPTVLLVIGTQPCAQSCASLSLELVSGQSAAGGRRDFVFRSRFSVLRERSSGNGNDSCARASPSHAELLSGMEIHVAVLRSRTERKPVQSASAIVTKTAWTA